MSASHFPDSPTGSAIQVSARLSHPSPAVGDAVPVSPPPERVDGASASTAPVSCPAGGTGPVARRRLYDQNLSDWSARVRKNKQNLDVLERDCNQLRAEVAKAQQETDDREDKLRQLEDRHVNEVMVKFNDAKGNFDVMTQQKQTLATQLSDYRKLKSHLTKERRVLQSDFERKHAERNRTAEARDKLEAQIEQLMQHLAQLSSERRRMERDLDTVQNNLRAHTDLADEVHTEIEHVRDGIKDSVDLTAASRAPECARSALYGP